MTSRLRHVEEMPNIFPFEAGWYPVTRTHHIWFAHLFFGGPLDHFHGSAFVTNGIMNTGIRIFSVILAKRGRCRRLILKDRNLRSQGRVPAPGGEADGGCQVREGLQPNLDQEQEAGRRRAEGPPGGIMKVFPAASDLRDRAGTWVPPLPPGSTRLLPDLLHGLRSVVEKEGAAGTLPTTPSAGRRRTCSS